MTDTPKTEKTFPLAFPFEWEGRRFSTVKIMRPKVKTLRKIEAIRNGGGEVDEEGRPIKPDDFDAGLQIMSLLTGIPVGAIDELDSDDFVTLSEYIADFFPEAAGPKTGDTSSPKPPTG